MSRAKPRKKAYRPSSPAVPPMLAHLMLRASASATEPVASEKIDRMMTTFWSAIDCVARGRDPEVEDWRQIADAINYVETMMLRGHLDQQEVRPTLEAAVAGMAAAAERYKAGKGLRMDAPGLNAVRETLSIFELAARELPEIVMMEVQHETQQRIAQILADRDAAERVTAV
jgi:hypothetical protein